MDNILAAALRYLAFAVLAVVGPGLVLPRLLRLTVDPALVLPTGIAVAAGAWWIALASGQDWLFAAIVIGLDALLVIDLWRTGGRLARAPGPPLRGAIPPLVAIVVLLALTQYPWNRIAASGELLLDAAIVPYDTAFHVGLSHELTFAYPPQVPGLSGFALGYHLGTDLLRAAALRWAGVHPYDSIARFDVTLFAAAVLLAVRGATFALGGSPRAVDLSGWTLLLTDLSWVFATNPQAHWWADLLRGNLLVSLALANPVMPALALALGVLVALARHAQDGGRWLWMAAGLAAAVPFFKVFLGAHLAFGLLVAAAVGAHTRGALFAAGATALGTLALAWGRGGQSVGVALAPLDLVRITRESLSLPPLEGAALVAWALLWLAASLGLRVVGVPAAARALRTRSPLAVALGAMALVAWPAGLLLRVSAPEVLPGQKMVNDAAYLVEQGGPLLWIFAATAVAGWMGTSRMRSVLVLLAVALLSAPSTVHFAAKKASAPPDPLPAAMVRAMRSLEDASSPGDVVLQRPGARFPPAPVIVIGRRVPYERFTPWLTQFAPAAALQARHETVYRFFHTEDREEAIAIARALGARYVCLYERDRLRFEPGGLVEWLHDEPGARCGRLVFPQIKTTSE